MRAPNRTTGIIAAGILTTKHQSRAAITLFLYLGLVLNHVGGISTLAADSVLGLVSEAPSDGRFVKSELGFMVPYQVTIPGTNISYEMTPIPGGELVVVTVDQTTGFKRLSHTVAIAPFWMGNYEVTWGEYEPYAALYSVFSDFREYRFRDWDRLSDVDAVSAPTELYDSQYHFQGASKRLPVVGVTQFAARQYSKWLSQLTGRQYRLPAEAEWEYACRAGTTTQFSWGDDMLRVNTYAVVFSAGRVGPDEVGRRRPNQFGLYDMHGNLAEWVLDGYSRDGIPQSSNGELADLVRWPEKIHPRIVRGGWWESDAHACRSAARMSSTYYWSDLDPSDPVSPWWHNDGPAQGVGFRIVRSLKSLPPEILSRVWNPDCDELAKAVLECEKLGRGAIGRVDPNLPELVQRYEALGISK